MSKVADRNGDIALLLYSAPFVLNFVWALYLWFGTGLSATLPQLVFLEVAQNPYLFLAGFGTVVFAAVIDFNSEPPERRKGALSTLSKRLQAIAFLSSLV